MNFQVDQNTAPSQDGTTATMDPSQDFKTIQESIQGALVAATRTVNGLANEDLQFQRTVDPTIGNRLDDKSERLLQLASGLLKSAGNATNQKAYALEDADDVDIHWRGIVDVIDSLLEKADTCLDEYTGLIKRKDAPTAESGRTVKRSKAPNERLDWSLKRANILKPQNAFEKKTDNFDAGPWKPLLTKKPHATVPLEKSLVTFTEKEYNTIQYKHPYETEITNLQYPESIYEVQPPKKYLPIETTTAVWVDTYEGVLEMLEELKQAKEIALDLEHHDYRSYTGLLSLMQISTREKDWIVDTLVPWRHKLEVLNEVFADPSIIKVLHGAFMDVIWLQRDLGLYVVGLFDTHHACDMLGYSGKSLAFLLKKFVDFDADKKYQLADWRIRPLPTEMFYYARSDTHYLLYIYDMVRNELVERSNRGDPENDLIEIVLRKSKDVSLLRYEAIAYDSETGQAPRGWFNALSKSSALYDSEQFAVYRALHKWRDDISRLEDESPVFYMNQQVLADIARVLPADKKALWSLLDSNARGLKVHLDELFDLVQSAKASGLNGPRMMDFFRDTYGGASSRNTPMEKSTRKGAEANDGLDIKELKSQSSRLWGNVAMSSVWDGSARANKSTEKSEVIIPYPRFVPETLSPDSAAEQQKAASVAAEPVSVEVEPPVNQEFTIKGGHKRKLAEANAESESESEAEADAAIEAAEADNAAKDVVMDDDSDDDSSADESAKEDKKALEKAAKKLERKKARQQAKKGAREAKKLKKAKKAEEKAARQLLEQSAAAGGDEDEDEEPFDYSKAASVLNPAKGGGGGGGKPSRAFDPYSRKNGATIQGARAHSHVKAGRTATFKK
ncbi:ribonuclease H-like domain-containing protein [Bombardia bombarda]|uniref:Ribonuclease H-like domain-containing protein n=1 Tax=Bombardia bombarda TaxID=252184 RepID=A0AA39X162_9PEZI|nr:ribonuclease H-like domain-containing protein [Bombardia bombarda]